MPTDAELTAFELRIHPESRSGAINVLARYFAWGLIFTEDRNNLTERLSALYAGQELMLTPAMVDYDMWLEAPDDGLPAQVQVMEAIAARRAAGGMPVHAFLAFDPWRCLQERANGSDLLTDLKSVLGRGGGIGVKLYPPMGFSAAGNAEQPAEFFPKRLQRLTNGKPGLELDAVMDELFDHLSEQGIPVMAHCGQSNGSEKKYEALAGPQFWRKALERQRPRVDRRSLRVNLGHFGGIWDLGTSDDAQRKWAQEIAALMQDFPNTYADVGYFGSVLGGEQEAAIVDQTVVFIEELADRPNSRLRHRLMYGSDWSMIGQEEAPQTYPQKVIAALGRVWPGDMQEDLRWKNAARYLGLGAKDTTRIRLNEFYEARGLSRAPLDRFSV
jgi:predicted TIM-barrel fold metal-dependent hydrolase